MNSEKAARRTARKQLGRNPIKIRKGKYRSRDGRRQYRALHDDVKKRHVHFETIDPKTGKVIKNIHYKW